MATDHVVTGKERTTATATTPALHLTNSSDSPRREVLEVSSTVSDAGHSRSKIDTYSTAPQSLLGLHTSQRSSLLPLPLRTHSNLDQQVNNNKAQALPALRSAPPHSISTPTTTGGSGSNATSVSDSGLEHHSGPSSTSLRPTSSSSSSSSTSATLSSSSSRRKRLDPINTSRTPTASAHSPNTAVPTRRLSIEEELDTVTKVRKSSVVDRIAGNTIHRRRLSNPAASSNSPKASRNPSIDHLSHTDHPAARSPLSPSSSRSRRDSNGSSFNWFNGNRLTLPAHNNKHSKSDDEREDDREDEYHWVNGRESALASRTTPQAPCPRQQAKKKRAWFGMSSQQSATEDQHSVYDMSEAPSISMTPPIDSTMNSFLSPTAPAQPHLSLSRQSSFMGYIPTPSPSNTFAALPTDPNNILPLTMPPSPMPSPPISLHATPFHTPLPSFHDLPAEFAMSASMSGSSASAATGPSASPRTSISTSSSRPGWVSGSGGRSDSRSSGEDNDSPINTSFLMSQHGHKRGSSWWWKNLNELEEAPVSPKISGPMLQPRSKLGSAARLVPGGTRNWGWVLQLVRDRVGGATPNASSASASSRRDSIGKELVRGQGRNREKDRLMAGYGRKRSEKVMGSKWLGRLWAFVPTTPLSIVSGSQRASLGGGPLTWGQCAFTLFFAALTIGLTMTIKYILNPDKEALPWRDYCTSAYPTLYSLQDVTAVHGPGETPVSAPFSVFGASSPDLVLAPVTQNHSVWPYSSDHSPYSYANLASVDQTQPVGVFLGVFTTDAGAERRHLIRQSYASHWRSRTKGTEGVKVRFVMGRPRAKFAQAVQMEKEAFDDILILDIPENMNSGKTHAFFTWASENATVPSWQYHKANGEQTDDPALRPSYLGERQPDYVVKADDDSFIMLGELEKRLRFAPRTKAYWGYLVKNLFMGGECYALSYDLVKYIGSSPALRTFTRGKEDKLVSKWITMHPQREEIMWVTEKCWIYDHPKAGTVYSHGFLYPSEAQKVQEGASSALQDSAELRDESSSSYSTVLKFGRSYRGLGIDTSAAKKVEMLTEGSQLSKLVEEQHKSKPTAENLSKAELSRQVEDVYRNSRPTRKERFLSDESERGGTAVVHYIKKTEWFVETMIAMLGSADEQAVWHRGVGNGLGLLERRKGRVVEEHHEKSVEEAASVVEKGEGL